MSYFFFNSDIQTIDRSNLFKKLTRMVPQSFSFLSSNINQEIFKKGTIYRLSNNKTAFFAKFQINFSTISSTTGKSFKGNDKTNRG